MKNKNNKEVVFVVIFLSSLVTSFLLGMYLGNNNVSMFNYSLAKATDIKKIDDNKEIVYSRELYIPDKLPEDLNSDEVITEIPIINLDFESVKKINKELLNQYNEVLEENIITDDIVNINSIKYKYYINNNILSLILEYKNFNYTAGYITYEYKTYNININNGTILSNNDLIKIKNLNEDDVYNKIINHVEKEYQNLGYDDYKNTDFYKESINNIKENNKITTQVFIDNNNELNTYVKLKMNMGPGSIIRNYIIK